MGIWIELGIFLLVFVFAYFQLRELKQEKLKREKRESKNWMSNKKTAQCLLTLCGFYLELEFTFTDRHFVAQPSYRAW